jgi:MinD superfamily P-loop ATPase
MICLRACPQSAVAKKQERSGETGRRTLGPELVIPEKDLRSRAE